MVKYRNCLLLVLLFNALFVTAQTPNGQELVGIHNVEAVEIDNIQDPIVGSMVYNSTDEKLYLYTANYGWQSVGLSSVIVKEVTADYEILSSDTDKVLKINSSSDITITIPTGLSVGFNISAYQYGTGTVSFVGSGTTLRHRLDRFKIAGQYAGVGIISLETDEFSFTGDLRK